MNNTPKVSIVLPCYNGAALLGQAIESCINQTYNDWELIIVNDCSTDNTLEVANAYAQKDERIRVYTNEKNSKLPATLNNGFRRATGEYWTWTSDDNLLHPEMLENFVAYLDGHKDVGCAVSDSYVIDENNKIIGEKIVPDDLNSKMMLNNYVGASFMYRKECALAIGEYREDLFLVEDYEFFIRMSFHCKMGHISQFLYYYMNNPNSLTATRKKEIRERLVRMRIMYLDKAEDAFRNNPKLLTLVYYRIVDNLFGKEKLRYYIKFAKKLPFHFGVKYLFVHLPKTILKKFTRR